MTRFRIGVVGAGRVGAVLASALRSAGHDIVAVSGASPASQTRIETLVPGVAVRPPAEVAAGCDLLLVSVPDDQLAPLVAQLAQGRSVRAGQYVVHTSGRHGTGVLAPLAALGARPVAMHPAMTFTGTDLDLARLRGCVFGVTADPSLRGLVEALAGDLGARTAWIDEADRTLYHAALAHGANHLVTLVVQAMKLLRAAGSSDPAATLRPLLNAALENALSYGDAALTGPIVRGDVPAVRAHLRQLADLSPELLESYVAMGRATVNHAVSDGRLHPLTAAALVEVLTDALAGSPA
jgi:predicted short-subunit dehydrogenase-like oxidoreductase (DUF2520 family)